MKIIIGTIPETVLDKNRIRNKSKNCISDNLIKQKDEQNSNHHGQQKRFARNARSDRHFE